jgi:hypothetical protein
MLNSGVDHCQRLAVDNKKGKFRLVTLIRFDFTYGASFTPSGPTENLIEFMDWFGNRVNRREGLKYAKQGGPKNG